jgi:hypothetical protein
MAGERRNSSVELLNGQLLTADTVCRNYSTLQREHMRLARRSPVRLTSGPSQGRAGHPERLSASPSPWSLRLRATSGSFKSGQACPRQTSPTGRSPHTSFLRRICNPVTNSSSVTPQRGRRSLSGFSEHHAVSTQRADARSGAAEGLRNKRRAARSARTDRALTTVGQANQKVMNSMNIMNTVNVNTTRRPRVLPVARGIRSRAQPAVRAARRAQRGRGSLRGCLDASGRQQAGVLTGTRSRKPVTPPGERRMS